MIDLMPPGLYEAVIEEIAKGEANRELIGGDYLFRLMPRTLDDIRALGGNSPEDDLKFAAVDRLSNVNRRLYENYLGPMVRAVTPPGFGGWARKMHPNRVRFSIFSDENPGMRLIAETAEQVRKNRHAVGQDNFFAAAEKTMASTISASLSAFGAARDAMIEQLFNVTYGSPFLQALVGLDPKDEASRQQPQRDALREQVQARKRQELEAKFESGGAVEAALRSIAFVRLAQGSVDERGYAIVKQLHDAQPPGRPRTMDQLKETVREQYLLLKIDEKRAVAAIPKLIPRDPDERAKTLRAIQRVISATGEPTGEAKRRLSEIERLFGAKASRASKKEDDDVRA
jgi:hypothetical protein